jgi:hypothetical protein
MGIILQTEGIVSTRSSEEPVRQMLDDLTVEFASTGSNQVHLGASWTYEPALNYYRLTRGLTWLKKVDRAPLRETFDYYFYGPSDVPALREKELVTLHTYPQGKLTLAKNVRATSAGTGTPPAPASAIDATSVLTKTP